MILCASFLRIAANAGAAIHTARLHAETQRHASQMATIANIGRELSANLNLDTVAESVVKNVHDLFGASDTVLRLLDPDGRTLRTPLAIGQYATEYANDTLSIGKIMANGERFSSPNHPF